MKNTRVIANILYYVTKVLGGLYALTAIYALLTIVFKSSSLVFIEGGERFEINFPFTDTAFLIADYNQVSIVEMVLGIGLYGVFLLLASNIFDTFRQEKLFTNLGISRLRIFYLANLVIPPLIILVFSVISSVEHTMIIMALIHIILSVFTYFLAAIFKQGVQLQNEQELFI